MAKEENGKYSVFTMRVLSILWCDGSPPEKAAEFYANLQDMDTIACGDKDFKPNLYAIFDLATEMVFKNEPWFMGTDVNHIFDAKVAEVKETYDDLAEEFLDAVFDVESKLTQSEWETEVAKKCSYLFNPEDIRKKLGYV